VPEATQWDQSERVADCAYPGFRHRESLAAQGEVIYQDDTPVRILSLLEENRQAEAAASGAAQASPRTGMYTTGLVVQGGAHLICLYYAGRQPAGENLEALLRHRAVQRDKPLVLSDALASNAANEQGLIRCHCLAHGQRKFRELEEVFPAECAVVPHALTPVFEPEEEARKRQLRAEERLAYPQPYRGPLRGALKIWLEQQSTERRVEPNSSLGKAIAYLLGHWVTLTRFSMAS
jgi:transposase